MNPKPGQKLSKLEIGEEQIKLLEQLSNASGVSGDEGEVRSIVLEKVRPLADEVKVDALGNVIACHKAKEEDAPRVMLAAHMDEVGLMIKADDGEGLFQFKVVGGIDARQLPGRPVLIGKNHIPAVIGARAIHLTTAEERKHAIPIDTMRLDVGLGDAKNNVKMGDRAVFATRFSTSHGAMRGKALDDRLGVVTLIEILKNAPENVELYAVFTTQEEIGGRGARTAAYSINPDLAIALDSTPAHDLPTWDDNENIFYNSVLGAGPAIYTMDRATISDTHLVSYLITTAEKGEIPYQLRQPGGGGTDAGAIHLQREGIPSVSISVPGRHAHTAIGLAYIKDWENTLKLLYAALAGLTHQFLEK